MKVVIVEVFDYWDTHTIRIFTTMEKALAWVAASKYAILIQEKIVDDTSALESKSSQ